MDRGPFPSGLSDWESFLAKIVAFGASIWALWTAGKFFMSRARAGWRTIRSFAGSVDALERIASDVAIIQARTQAVIEMSPTPAWQADSIGRITGANAALLKILELPLSEIIGQGWESSIHPSDFPRILVAWDLAVKERTPFNQMYRLRIGRQTIQVMVKARPVFGRKNDLIEFQGTMQVLLRSQQGDK